LCAEVGTPTHDVTSASQDFFLRLCLDEHPEEGKDEKLNGKQRPLTLTIASFFLFFENDVQYSNDTWSDTLTHGAK
jgi:hypothetical protein